MRGKVTRRKFALGFRCNGRTRIRQGLAYALCGNGTTGASAMFSPLLRELTEMRFQRDRPYHVDASHFAAALWSDATPFETGVPETALAFRAALRRGAETCLPIRAAIGADRAASDQVASVHVPDRGLAVRVLKKNVGAVATGSDGVPTRPGIGADWPAANEFVPVHLPDRDLAAAGVLKKDLGKAVAVEIARSDRFQAGPGLGFTGPPPISLFPSDSRRVRPDDTGQLHSAHGRAVCCRPQPKVAAGVDLLEQNLAVKEVSLLGERPGSCPTWWCSSVGASRSRSALFTALYRVSGLRRSLAVVR
jgi:hypothetical protein